MFKAKDENSACMEDCGCPYKAGYKVRELVDTATSEIRNTKAFVAQKIRRDPIGTTAMIASLAYMVGKLLRRR